MDAPTPPPPRRRHRYGPRTWALAREFYLAGASAAEVEARLGVGVSALRQRAFRERWTKTAAGDAFAAPLGHGGSAPPPTPPAPAAAPVAPTPLDAEALAQAVARRAVEALADGRAAEAAALAKACEPVMALLDALPPPPDDVEAVAAARRAELEARLEREWRTAVRLAEALLKDGHVPAIHTRAALHWRAEHLGPDVAEADRTRVIAGASHQTHYDERGLLRPPITFAAFFAERR